MTFLHGIEGVGVGGDVSLLLVGVRGLPGKILKNEVLLKALVSIFKYFFILLSTDRAF